MENSVSFENENTSRYYITIPKDRIGALIGPSGRVKKRLEETAGVEVNIDSASGDVEVVALPNAEDPFLAIKARDFVHAVGRGFNPHVAFALLQDDIYFEVINLKIIFGDNQNKIKRFRGRIIGREGRTRKVVEETTGTRIVVYGNTVAILGQYERLKAAKEAIYLLLDGAKHGTVYAYLEEKAQLFRMSQKDLWDKASRDAKI